MNTMSICRYILDVPLTYRMSYLREVFYWILLSSEDLYHIYITVTLTGWGKAGVEPGCRIAGVYSFFLNLILYQFLFLHDVEEVCFFLFGPLFWTLFILTHLSSVSKKFRVIIIYQFHTFVILAINLEALCLFTASVLIYLLYSP